MPEKEIEILPAEFITGNVYRNPLDGLDYKLPGLSILTAAANELEPVDWERGFLLPELPPENQGSSGSCTEQAFCYDFMNKHGIDLSRRDGYSRIARPDAPGAMPHEPYWKFDTEGQHTRENSADPSKQTEANMKELVNIPIDRYHELRVKYWSPVDYHIDTIARMVQNYKGITGSFTLTGEGWADKKYPRAPLRTDTNWRGGHMLQLCGFGLVDGIKKIIARSSWKGVKYHYFGEDYYNLAAEWVYGHYWAEYRKVLVMNNEYVVIEYNGKLGVGLFDGGFIEPIAWAKDKQQILDICKTYGVVPVGYDPNGYPLPTHSIKKIR